MEQHGIKSAIFWLQSTKTLKTGNCWMALLYKDINPRYMITPCDEDLPILICKVCLFQYLCLLLYRVIYVVGDDV